MSQWANTSSAVSTHCFFFCTGLSSTMFHFSSSEKNSTSSNFTSLCWVLSAFESPLPFCIGNKKQAPLAVLLHAIFRGSRSACSPVSCTLYDVRQWLMPNGTTTDADRRAIYIYIFFFHGGANVAQKNRPCEITDRITDRKVIRFGFRYLLQITDNRIHSSVG